MSHKLINLSEELDKIGYNPITEYTKALKKKDMKRATAIAKLFPYILRKPTKDDEQQEDNKFHGIMIQACPYDEACKFCQDADKKYWEEVNAGTRDLDDHLGNKVEEKKADNIWKKLSKEEKIKLIEQLNRKEEK